MDIPNWLHTYAEQFIKENNVDSSHDLTHFMNVCNYAKEIVEHDYPDQTLIDDLSEEDSLKILYHAAFSHDLIDSKYVNSSEHIIKLKDLFLKNSYNPEHLDIILFLIDNISYSKQRTGKYPIPKKYQLIMNILSDADKLDAYRVERVISFQHTKNQNPEDTQKWIKTILVKRVLKYRGEWLKTEYAKQISKDMHQQVLRYVDNNLLDVGMVDY